MKKKEKSEAMIAFRYIFGKNSAKEKIPMTTPVFTQAVDDVLSRVSIQIVLPMNKELKK